MYPSVRDETLAAAFPSIKAGLQALGFDAVELNYGRDGCVRSITGFAGQPKLSLDSASGIRQLQDQLASAGCRVSALLLSNDFGTADVDAEVRWVVSAVRAAARLGVPVVRIDAIMHGERDMPTEKRARHFAECMARVLEATSDTGVDMGIENHGFQGNDPDFLDQVLSAVDSPRVGLTLDTGNFYWAGHPISRVYEILEHFAPRCKHTHAKNIKYPEEMRDVKREVGWRYGEYVSPLRDGDIDHARVVQILKNGGYDRDLCLEDESLGKWDADGRIAVLKDDAAFFKEIL